MGKEEKKIHKGLTLDEVDRVNDNINFVQEVLRLVLVASDCDYAGSPPSTDMIVGEALDRVKKIDAIINQRNAVTAN
jgi:hypothetical protein